MAPHTLEVNTVGARIPNVFGFRMVDSVRFMVPTIQILNMVSLGRFIYKHYFYLYIKRSRLTAILNLNDWLQTEHSKSEPSQIRLLKRSVFEWIRISNGRNSSPHCINFKCVWRHLTLIVTCNQLRH